MHSPFSARSVTVGELFGGPASFNVPDYQRAYAWTATEAGRLIDDLLLALDEAGPERKGPLDDYFLGAIVLMEAEAEGTDNETAASFEIVDGLQRIVTLTILLAVLRDLLAGDKPDVAERMAGCIWVGDRKKTSDRPRLDVGGGRQPFFRTFVLERNATAAMPDEDDLPEAEHRMLAVREHLMAVLVGEDPEQLRLLGEFVLDRCHCAIIATRTLDRAHRIFSVLNDRGRPLARGDILKAQILGSVEPQHRSAIAQTWSALEHDLGGSLEELLGHVRTIESSSRRRIIDDIRALIQGHGGAEAFVAGMVVPYGRILATIRSPAQLGLDNGRGLQSELAARIGYLGWLGNGDWVPPLMLLWRRSGGAADVLVQFVGKLDRLAYTLRILGIGADKRARRYGALLAAVRADTWRQPGSPLDLTRDEQRLVTYNLRNLHVRSQTACKLLLLRLNDEIAGSPQHLDPGAYTVEHILPQKPPRTSVWREWFPTAEERDPATQSLGNLILVSRDCNERARNLEFGHKLDIFFGSGAGQPAITREIEGLREWRLADVRRREERLMSRLAGLWPWSTAQPGEGKGENCGRPDPTSATGETHAPPAGKSNF